MFKINIIGNNDIKRVLIKAYKKEEKNYSKKILIFFVAIIIFSLGFNYIINIVEFIIMSIIILSVGIIIVLTSIFKFIGKLF